MNKYLELFEPTVVWKHFRTLCDIPRPSYHEAQLRNHLVKWAQEQGLETYIDSIGNLLIRKDATIGMEDRETVVLQGHLDMVAQKNTDTEHDFTKDSLKTHIVDGWVTAKGTTLGADNGIGVAAALAVLESKEIAHGPIEALFTIEEETSLRGATELEEGILKGRLLLNLDSEDRGDVYIGCAGGIDVNVDHSYPTIATNKNQLSYELIIQGLRGGHSGLDINKGRASANVFLSRILMMLDKQNLISLATLEGGTLRNAIAREAKATLVINNENLEIVESLIKRFQQEVQTEYSAVEKNIEIAFNEINMVSETLTKKDQKSLVRALRCTPHGVHRMSSESVGVTETSCNFSIIELIPSPTGGLIFSARLLVRSLINTSLFDLADIAQANFEQIGATVILENYYSGWRPDPDAGLLAHFLRIHKNVMGYKANVKVIHAGLECGIIGSKYPDMEMVSFGPNIRGAHSPDERLEIDSVLDFWSLLTNLLAQTPVKQKAIVSNHQSKQKTASQY